MAAATPGTDATPLDFLDDVSSLDEGRVPYQHSHDDSLPDSAVYSQGILDLLAPVMQELDMRVAATRDSQADLHREIQRLQAELQMLLTATAVPPGLNAEVEAGMKKLDSMRKRLAALNSNLASYKTRLDKCLTIIAAPRR
ncbi:hypothetical protein DFJ74DRAFT_680196 [Hyaloraphidium curvatum]|nr:hypothetical protein DFJ74DRAFT_680196 [Hyaloraphidium curvatum]